MTTKGTPVYGSVYAFPAMDYMCRTDKDDPAPFGPMTLETAKGYARRASRTNVGGLMEVYTIVGTREGDPADTRPAIKVLMVYRRGKALVGSALAQYVSDHKFPPAV